VTTPDHKVAMLHLAADLRAAGKPIWSEKIDLKDVFHDKSITFEQRRDAIVARLKMSRWYIDADPDELDGVREIIDCHLAEAEDVDEFDGWWSDLYDHADYARVWIGTV
jgi:hypothetical protein